MHGRLKVRSSAEEAARKKKEQALKVKAYRFAMTKVFEKRQKNELDEEMLTITGQILIKNPDITTLWNIRRECILNLNTINENQLLFTKDLNFTEQCLKVNPKSYCAWHHRCWILENCSEPDWDKEVVLCTLYLKTDERNFHCWDYRRYVTEKANIPKKSELDFCTEKIEKNFSNYSSWHYRSKLLPILYPHNSNSNRPINEEKLQEELELVLTAAFTDPNDSSAWFYQRWLLGYSEPELDICAFRIINDRVIISFTKFIDLKEFVVSSNVIDLLNVTWKPSRHKNSLDNTWIGIGLYDLPSTDENFTVFCTSNENTIFELKLKKCVDGFVGLKCPSFQYEFGSSVLDVLKNQLESCQELLVYEPDSKWTLLTAALLMRAIDRKLYHDKSIEYLKQLEKIDNMRIGYYRDLSSKWKIENKIEDWIKNDDIPSSIDLSGLELTTIVYEQYLSIADNIDLSNNKLNNRSWPKLLTFQFVKNLSLKGNSLTDTEEYADLKCLENLVLDDDLSKFL